MKSSFVVVFGLLLLGGPVSTANAGPLLWTLSTLTFNRGSGLQIGQGGTGSGFFLYDRDTNTYSAWSINITGFPLASVNGLITPANSSLEFPPDPTFFSLLYSSGQAEFIVEFFRTEPNAIQFGELLPLTNSGGTRVAGATVGCRFNCQFVYWVAEGTVTSTPEPAPFVLVLLGGASLCIFSIFLRKRRSSQ